MIGTPPAAELEGGPPSAEEKRLLRGGGYECALAIECLHGYDKNGDKTQLHYTSTRP